MADACSLETTYAEYDARHRDWRCRQKSQDPIARYRCRDTRYDTTSAIAVPMVAARLHRIIVFLNASLVADSSKNTNSKLCSVAVLHVTSCDGTRENAALKQRAIRQKYRKQKNKKHEAERDPFHCAEPNEHALRPGVPPTTA